MLSTALTAPTCREKMMPLVMGKCLTRFLTSNSGVCPWATSAHLLPHDLKVGILKARCQVATAHVHEGGLLDLANGLRVLAAGVEPAALGHIEGARHHALDGLQPLLVAVQAGQGAQEAFGVRV